MKYLHCACNIKLLSIAQTILKIFINSQFMQDQRKDLQCKITLFLNSNMANPKLCHIF